MRPITLSRSDIARLLQNIAVDLPEMLGLCLCIAERMVSDLIRHVYLRKSHLTIQPSHRAKVGLVAVRPRRSHAQDCIVPLQKHEVERRRVGPDLTVPLEVLRDYLRERN